MKCPNCGKEISPGVKECPYCRKKLTETPKEEKPKERKAKKGPMYALGFGIVLVFAVGAVVLALTNAGRGKKTGTSEADTTPETVSTSSDAEAETETATPDEPDSVELVQKMKDRYRDLVVLGKYTDVVYTPTDATVSDADVQKKIDDFVSENATYKQVTDRACREGDTVNIDFTGRINGKEFEGGSTGGSGTEITLGSSGYIDGFDKQIEGHKGGDTFDVKVTFPKDYAYAELAGKDAVFETTLNFIVEEEPATYSDALVASNTDYNSMAEFEEATRRDLYDDAEADAISADRQSILKSIESVSEIKSYPEDEVKLRRDIIVQNMKDRAKAANLSYDQVLQNMYGVSASEFSENMETFVKNYLEEKMIVVAIADRENISVTKAEKDAKVNSLLENGGYKSVDELKEERGYRNEDFYLMVLEDKVFDFLFQHAVKAD